MDVCLNISRRVESLGFVFLLNPSLSIPTNEIDKYTFIIVDSREVLSENDLSFLFEVIRIQNKNFLPKLIIFDHHDVDNPMYNSFQKFISDHHLIKIDAKRNDHMKMRLSIELIYAIENVVVNFERCMAYMGKTLLIDFRNTYIDTYRKNIVELQKLYHQKLSLGQDELNKIQTLAEIKASLDKNIALFDDLTYHASPFKNTNSDPLILFNEQLSIHVQVIENENDKLSHALYQIDQLFIMIENFNADLFQDIIKTIIVLFDEKFAQKIRFETKEPLSLLSKIYHFINHLKEQFERYDETYVYVVECTLILSKINTYLGKTQEAFEQLKDLLVQTKPYLKNSRIFEYVMILNDELGNDYFKNDLCETATNHFKEILILSKNCSYDSLCFCMIYRAKVLNKLGKCNTLPLNERIKYHDASCIETYRLIKKKCVAHIEEIRYIFEDALFFYDQEGFMKHYKKLSKWYKRL
jgi:hypothetical protein